MELTREMLENATIEDLLVFYKKLNTRRLALQKEVETMKSHQDIIEGLIHDKLIASNQKGAVTNAGTVKRVEKTSYVIEDKEAFRNWVIESGHFELMNVTVAQRALSSFLSDPVYDEEGNQLPQPSLPAGVIPMTAIKLSITK